MMIAIFMNNVDEDEGDEDDDPFQATIFAQSDLGDHEKARLLQLLPPIGTYIGFPFMTRIKSMNLDNCVMACFLNYLLFFIVIM